MSGSPLSDITVVEAAESVGGAFCGRMLAAFGARVVKLERPPNGAWTRYAEPRLDGLTPPEAGALFLYDNMGKESVALDWHTPDGMAALMRLIRDADVLIDDWQPRKRRALGIDAARLKALNPALINLSLTPFGLDGPYADWQATPLVSLALGGYLYLSGDEAREPLMLPGYQAQRLAAMKGYAGVLLALRARDVDGVGQPVQVSEMETLVALHQFTIVARTYDGIVRKRAGVRLAAGRRIGGYPITTLPCKDGYITFSASAPYQWDYLCAAMGREDLLIDSPIAAAPSLRDAAHLIDEILLDWVKDKTRQEIVDLAAGVYSVPASPVLDITETLQDGQYAERRLFQRIEHPQGAAITFPTVPYHMSETPPAFTRAPALGEHTAPALARAHSDAADARNDVGVRNNGAASNGISVDRAASNAVSPPPPTAKPARKALLDGVRVLDLTRVWAGPLVGRILADFGAHVIRISDPRIPQDRTMGTNNKLGRNKDHIALRLDLADGKDAFLDLAAVSDIVIESFRPHVMRNFGLDYPALRRVRPDLIMCSLSGYGAQGANAEFPAYGTSVESITGVPSLMGYENEMPMTSGIAYPDPVAGLNAAAAMLTALRHRTATGEGQFIDLALAEGPVCHIGEHIAAVAHNGRQPPRRGNKHREHAPHGVYPARGNDRWLAIAVTSQEQWRALCGIMEMPELADDKRFRSQTARKTNEDALNRIIADWTQPRDALETMRALQTAGVPAGAAHTNIDLLNDPHLRQRDFFVDLDEPDIGVMTYPGQAIITDGLNKRNWRASAPPGAHNALVLNDLLGRPQTAALPK